MDCLFGGRVAKIRVKLNLSKMKVNGSGESDSCHCGYVATVEVKLKLHIIRVHEISFTPCDPCGNGISRQTNVKMHNSEVHGAKPTRQGVSHRSYPEERSMLFGL